MTRWQWQSPAGSVTDLSDWSLGSHVTVDGTGGELAPAYEFTTEQYAGVDGADLRHVAAQPRTVLLGLDVALDSEAAVRARARELAHVLRPRAGIGKLQAVADDGSVRTLPCRYRKGLESATFTANRLRAVLEFWSPSPWWRGDALRLDYGLAVPSAFFPILPIVLSSTTITGTTTVDLSDTDAPTFPLWTITGPGDQLTLRNEWAELDEEGNTVDRIAELVLPVPIGDGRTVTIDTRPGRQSIVRDDGVSLFGSLASDPALWSLVDTVQTVSALLTNAGPASGIVGVADRLYSGAR